MANAVVIVIIATLVFLAVRYIVKAKKSGVKCIGCPQAGQCASKANVEVGQENCTCRCH